MGFCLLGINEKVKGDKITVDVEDVHPLVKLANSLDWQHLSEVVLPDLKQTTSKWQ